MGFSRYSRARHLGKKARRANSKNHIKKFVSMMQQVKAGKEVDWVCPFCGGKVGLMEQQEHHAVIGCYSCDMRITLDN